MPGNVLLSLEKLTTDIILELSQARVSENISVKLCVKVCFPTFLTLKVSFTSVSVQMCLMTVFFS